MLNFINEIESPNKNAYTFKINGDPEEIPNYSSVVKKLCYFGGYATSTLSCSTVHTH